VDKRIKAAGKRYRYTGMERDDETGLAYHSARYYVPWLGRWASADPKGISAGLNLFLYADNSPIRFVDTTGLEIKYSEESRSQYGIRQTGFCLRHCKKSESKNTGDGDKPKPKPKPEPKPEAEAEPPEDDGGNGEEKEEKKKSGTGTGTGTGEGQDSVQKDGWFKLPSWAIKVITVAAIVTAVVALAVLGSAIIAGGLRFAGMAAFNALSTASGTATAIGGVSAITNLVQGGTDLVQGGTDLVQSGRTADVASFEGLIDTDNFNNSPEIIDRLSRAREFDIGGYYDLTARGRYGRVGDGLDSDEALQNLFVRTRRDVSRYAEILRDNPAMALNPTLHRRIENLRTPDLQGLSATQALRYHIDQLSEIGVENSVIRTMERESLAYIRRLNL
jgi:RHS repeat-associated protein